MSGILVELILLKHQHPTLLQSGVDANGSLLSLHVLDREFFTRGAEFVDLGHFAAEAWLYNHFYPAVKGAVTFSGEL